MPALVRLFRLTVGAVALVVTAFIGQASAATYTWTGAAGDAKWSTDGNWQGNSAPSDAPGPHDLVFPATAGVMFNDLPNGYTVRTLRFQGVALLTGNRLTVNDRIDAPFTGASTVTLNVQITLNGQGALDPVVVDTTATVTLVLPVDGPTNTPLRKEGAGTLVLSGANTYQGSTVVAEGILAVEHATSLGASTASTSVLNGATLRISGNTLAVQEPIVIAGSGPAGNGAALHVTGQDNVLSHVTLAAVDAGITVNSSRTATIDGGVSGGVGLIKRGLGTLILTGAANTYGGLTSSEGGTLVLQKAGEIAAPNGLSITSGTVRVDASHAIEGAVTIGNFGRLDLNDKTDTIRTLEGGGDLVLGAGSLTVASDAQPSYFSGTISGTGELRKVGASSLTLSGLAGGFTGTLNTFGGGTLQVDGLMGCAVALRSALRGRGTIGALTVVESAVIQPGGAGLTILRTGPVTLNAASSLRMLVVDSTSASGSTRLQVTGAVNLGNATLVVDDQNPSSVSGDPIVIVDNDGTDAVNGTFQGLAEDALVTGLNGRRFRLSYAGGTGNDVVLTPVLAYEYHLSEGATGPFFDTDLLIANPNAADAPVEIKYLKPGGGIVTQTVNVEGLARRTIRVDDVPGLESTEVSAIVTSLVGVPLIVERTMRWNETGYGAHTEKAVTSPSTVWFFAEGAQGFFSTYLLLANPQQQPNTATVEYLRQDAPPVTRTYPLEPSARLTVGAGADPELVNQAFGMVVRFALPGVAERAMYFGLDPVWKAGHESAGVTAPSTTWFLAEGATGQFFETFVLLANPQDAPADVTVTFLPSTGIPVVKTKSVPARGRLTINIEPEDPSLNNAAVATTITSTQPIVVERAQYWPDPAPQWYEAHNSFGVTAAGQNWGLAEGRVGGPEGYQTYILLANPGSTPANVTLTFLREGQPAFDKTFTVEPTSRFNVSTGPGSLVPELQDERFGARLVADAPIVVERAMYSNAGGQVWSAGTNATATRLP